MCFSQTLLWAVPPAGLLIFGILSAALICAKPSTAPCYTLPCTDSCKPRTVKLRGCLPEMIWEFATKLVATQQSKKQQHEVPLIMQPIILATTTWPLTMRSGDSDEPEEQSHHAMQSTGLRHSHARIRRQESLRCSKKNVSSLGVLPKSL